MRVGQLALHKDWMLAFQVYTFFLTQKIGIKYHLVSQSQAFSELGSQADPTCDSVTAITWLAIRSDLTLLWMAHNVLIKKTIIVSTHCQHDRLTLYSEDWTKR